MWTALQLEGEEVVLRGAVGSGNILILSVSVRGSDRTAKTCTRWLESFHRRPPSLHDLHGQSEPAPQVWSVESPADDSQLRSRRCCTQPGLTFDRPSQDSQANREAQCLWGSVGFKRTHCLRYRCHVKLLLMKRGSHSECSTWGDDTPPLGNQFKSTLHS